MKRPGKKAPVRSRAARAKSPAKRKSARTSAARKKPPLEPDVEQTFARFRAEVEQRHAQLQTGTETGGRLNEAIARAAGLSQIPDALRREIEAQFERIAADPAPPLRRG